MSAQLEHWDDIRIAYEVAKRGTLTAAAEAMNVHHSTILRRIDALEQRLNTRLFLRHARGYRPTEAGIALLQVAGGINDQMDKLYGHLQAADQQLSGALVITTVTGTIDFLTPWLVEFQNLYPKLQLEIRFDQRKLRLDHGEAHIALRPGKQPTEPDYIAQPIWTLKHGLYASKTYIQQHGLPRQLSELNEHKLISGLADSPAPFIQWIEANVAAENIVLRTSDLHLGHQAAEQGMGLFVFNDVVAAKYPDMIKVFDCEDMKEHKAQWQTPLWLVTHLMMHRTSRVKAFCDFVKQKFEQLA